MKVFIACFCCPQLAEKISYCWFKERKQNQPICLNTLFEEKENKLDVRQKVECKVVIFINIGQNYKS